ncbi:hypothetical protein ACFYZ8_33125 [Streptomyces sp. NPDC001668]|uniref:hypothetical protein n=1 Tax=Streptomyces sp. NPDC001668 TaxID=3364598 RepID=UPI003688AC46
MSSRTISVGNMDFEHCSGCGQAYPYEQAHDSYTGCCNEGVCGGPRDDGTANWNLATSREGEARWVTVRVIRACCGAGADVLAKELGLVVTSMNVGRD